MVVQGSSFHSLALDLGGTKLAYRLSSNAELIDEGRWILPNKASGQAELNWVIEKLSKLTRAYQGELTVGMSAAPSIALDGTITAWPNRPDWVGLTLKTSLEKALGSPVTIRDDGYCATLAEFTSLNEADMALFVLGTGVGGGVVSMGRVITGFNAPELGHVIVFPNGRVCKCGRLGCLQAYASGPAIAQCGVDGAIDALALTISNLAEIFGTRVFSLSGGAVPGLGPDVLEKLQAGCRKWGMRTQVEIVYSKMGQDSPIFGAEILTKQIREQALGCSTLCEPDVLTL